MVIFDNRYFPARTMACLIVEGGIIIMSVLASFFILQDFGSIKVVSFNDAVIRGIVIAIFCQACMYMLDLYDLKVSTSWGGLFFSIVFAVGFVCIGIGIVSYIVPVFAIEGLMYYITIIFVGVFLILWRVAFHFYLSRLAFNENILIVGTGEVARTVAIEIEERRMLGFHLVGYVDVTNENNRTLMENGKVLGNAATLVDIAKGYKVRKVVIALEERRGEYPVKELLDLRVMGVKVIEWPEFAEQIAGRVQIDRLAPSYFIFNKGFRKSKLYLYFRRIYSIIAATIMMIVLASLFALVAILIKLDSSGPIIYSQDRVGQNGKIFRIFKFRTMRDDAESDGIPKWASKDDPRVTRVGWFLRASRIDELPQLVNIFLGDLDLVGPRPERPDFVEKLQNLFPYYSLRHSVKPGITGWAQVMFSYGSNIEESKEKLQYDLFYIKNMSIKIDLLIIFRTVKIVILGRGAR